MAHFMEVLVLLLKMSKIISLGWIIEILVLTILHLD